MTPALAHNLRRQAILIALRRYAEGATGAERAFRLSLVAKVARSLPRLEAA